MRSLRLPKTLGEWRTGGVQKLLGQAMSDRWNKAVVSSYWATASMIIIWGDYFKTERWPNVGFQASSLEWSKCGWATVACLAFIGAFVIWINRLRGIKILAICIPLVVLGISLPWIYNAHIRTAIMSIGAASFASLYIFAYRYEGIDGATQSGLMLMHRRYLEYMRSLIWISAFFLVGYLYWEVSTLKYESIKGAIQAMHGHAIISAMQLAITVGGGVGLIIYGITRKLEEIEGATDQKI